MNENSKLLDREKMINKVSLAKFLLTSFSLLFSIACSFGQGELPVDIYTGTPSISVPIWTIAGQDVSESISLEYSANQRSSSRYGLGWSLQGGGSITREVRGLPDDFGNGDNRKGWLYNNASSVSNASDIGSFSNSADLSAATCTDEATDYNKLSSLNYLVDTEPDIFHYSFGGYAGSFVFDNNLNIRLIPYRDIKIEFTPISGTDKKILSFKITTNTGYSYTFSQMALTSKTCVKNEFLNTVSFLPAEYEFYKTVVNYTSEWALTKIDSPTGANLTFNYTSETKTTDAPMNLGIYIEKPTATLGATDLRVFTPYTINQVQGKNYLSSVSSSAGSAVEFYYESNLLTKIVIRDNRKGVSSAQNYVKEFDLAYQAVTYYGEGNFSYLRNFLSSVTELSGCDRLPSYKFTYNKWTSLDDSGTNIDFWGFYNGARNTHSIPRIYVYPAEPLAERYRLTPIPNYSGQVVVLNGADRTPNSSAMLNGTLNRIVYPSGGSTNLKYEANQYLDARTNESLLGGGLRIASAVYFDGIGKSPFMEKRFDYKDATGNSTGRLISKPLFAMPAYKWKNPDKYNSISASDDKTYASLIGDDIWKYLTVRTDFDLSNSGTTHGSFVGYQMVTVKRTGSGSAKFEYLMPGVYGEVTNGAWSASESKFARPTCPVDLGVISGGGAWGFSTAPNPMNDFERGLLWKKSEYNELGKLVRTTANTYQYLYKTGTQPVKTWGLKYDKYALCDDITTSNKIFLYSKYFLLTDVDKVLQQETLTTNDENDATNTKSLTESTNYIYGSSYHKLLTEVNRTASDGTIYGTRVRYPKDYSNVSANAENAVLMLSNLQNNFRHGIAIEQITTKQKLGDYVRVTGGSVVKFDPFDWSKPLLASEWKLATSKPVRLDSFKISSVVLQSPTYKFDMDTRYEKVSAYTGYASLFAPISMIGQNRVTTGVSYGYNNTLPVIQFSNVDSDQFAFSDFETSTINNWQYASSYLGAGRTGANSFYPGVKLSKVITKASGTANYLLSFYLKSNADVTFTVTLKNTTGTITYDTKNFVVTNTGGVDFNYVQQLVPLTLVPSSPFMVEVQAAALVTPPAGGSSAGLLPVIDDVAFFPDNASITTYTHTIPYGYASASNVLGQSTHTAYDNIGRVRYKMDKDKNIVQKNTYKYANDGIQLVADFPVSETLFVGEQNTYTAIGNSCLSGITYTWSFANGAPLTGISQPFTFNTVGTSSITLTATHAIYGTKTVSKFVVVSFRPISVAVCAKGVQEFSSSNNLILSSYACASIATVPPPYGTIFKVTSANCTGACTYQWKIRNIGTTSWINVGTGTDQYLYQKVVSITKSFEVMCDVSDGTGRTGSSPAISVIVSP
jgi:hypothetical protein